MRLDTSERARGRRCRSVAAALAVLGVTSSAEAGGWDTPTVYTARHQGMGGTAISYVDDASAGFHNPAGWSGVQGLGLMGDFSLLLARLRTSPGRSEPARSIMSELIVAPFFLVGAAYRVHEWVTVGAAVYPVASGGAAYEYGSAVSDARIHDSTKVVFFEGTLGASLNVPKDLLLPGELSVGFGYRAHYLTFDRKQGNPDLPPEDQMLDLELSGTNPFGYRVGLQYRPIDELTFGVVYRNKISVDAKADEVTVFRLPAEDAAMGFVLPAKLGFGLRFDTGRLGVAADAEHAFQSQNDRAELSGSLSSGDAVVPNVFEWKDAWTWRLGTEVRLGNRQQVPVRFGYVYDARVTTKQFPSAFGTPPTPTHALSAGFGYVPEPWQVNFAVVRRFGSVEITEDDLGEGCQFCSYAGDYDLSAVAFIFDASVDLDL